MLTREIDTCAWTQDEADKLEKAIYGLTAVNSEAELTVTGGWNRPPMERSATGAIFEKAQGMVRNLAWRWKRAAQAAAATATLPLPSAYPRWMDWACRVTVHTPITNT